MANLVQEVLISFEDKIRTALEESVMKNKIYSSGKLWGSVLATTKVFGQTVVLNIHMEDYGKFVNEGVNGTVRNNNSRFSFKKKNLAEGVMASYISHDESGTLEGYAKNISKQYKNSKGVLKTRKELLAMDKARGQLAFLMGRNVAKHGIKPTNFVKEALDTVIPEMEAALLKTVGRQIKLDIKEFTKQ